MRIIVNIGLERICWYSFWIYIKYNEDENSEISEIVPLNVVFLQTHLQTMLLGKGCRLYMCVKV